MKFEKSENEILCCVCCVLFAIFMFFCVFFYGSIFIPAHVPLNISFTPSSTVPVFFISFHFFAVRSSRIEVRRRPVSPKIQLQVATRNRESHQNTKQIIDKAGNTQIVIVYHAVNADQQDSKSGCCSSKEFIKIITMGIGGTRESSFAPVEEGTNARMDRKYQSLLAGGRSKSGEIWKI